MPENPAEADLILVALAWQMDTIDVDQAMIVLDDCNTQALDAAQSLLARRFVDRMQLKALQSLCDATVRSQDGERVINQLFDSAPGLRERWQSTDEPIDDGHASLGATLADPRHLESRQAKRKPASASERFSILRFHDEGGLGQVFEARDIDLNRNVAVKEMQQRFVDDQAIRERFEREAMITGGLEHPGIVPVYAIGHHSDGRPYYAMRFIKGETLREAIRAFHQVDWKQTSVAQPVELRRLLTRFLDVCHTIEYAHQRGVIHRDIKPDNVMVGKHGETLVVDWGLAKTFSSSPTTTATTEYAEDILELSGDADITATLAGRVVGSPLFMSPEQARGETETLGPATDIYSLGSLLFTLLTDKLAVDGLTTKEVLAKVIQGDVRTPQQVDKSVHADLDAICARAMSTNPEHRYPSVRDLANDIERHLADEPVLARRESWFERLSRVGRKNSKQLVIAAAGLVVATVITLAAAAISNSRTQARLANGQREKMFSFAREMTTMIPQKAGKQGTFIAYIDRLRENVAGRVQNRDAPDYDATIHAFLVEFISTAFLMDRRYRDTVELLEETLPTLRASLGENLEISSLYDHLAYAYLQSGNVQKSVEIYQIVRDIRSHLLEPTHRRQLTLLDNLSRAQLEAGIFDEAIQNREFVFNTRRLQLGERDPQTLRAMNNLASAYQRNESFHDALPHFERAYELRCEVLGADSKNTIQTRLGLADCLLALGRVDEALGHFVAARQSAREHIDIDSREYFNATQYLAYAELQRGKDPEALRHAEELDERTRSAYGDSHPSSWSATELLGRALSAIGEHELALQKLAELEQQISNIRPDSPPHMSVQRTIADVHHAAARWDQALTIYGGLRRQIEKRYRPGHRRHLDILLAMAETYDLQQDYKSALQTFEQAVAVSTSEQPLDRARHLLGCGFVHCKMGNLEQAEALLQAARSILASESSDHLRAMATGLLGTINARRGKGANAERLLLDSHVGLQTFDATPVRLRFSPRRIADELVELYTRLGRAKEADEWKTTREADLNSLPSR